MNFNDILKQGFGYVRLSTFPAKRINSPFPVHLIGTKYNVPELNLSPGINPTFFLEKDGVMEYAVINGFLVNLKKTDINVPNSMIFR